MRTPPFLSPRIVAVALLACLLPCALPARAQLSADHWNGGAIRVGPSATPCAAAVEGALRWNAVGKVFEMCDGATWKPVIASGNMPLLVVTPAGHDAMDISTPGAPAYGDYAIFTAQNVGNVASQPLSTTLTNTGNFEIGADTCTGNTLAAGGTCTIAVRPKAWGDGAYSGALSVRAGGTTAIATLSGTGTGSCGTLGGAMGGGLLAACMPGYALIVMKAGCANDVTDPACTETIDTLAKNYGQNGTTTNALSMTNGQDAAGGNTEILMSRVAAFGESFPAAEYCANMDYGGHTDWYLPSYEELRTICLNQPHLPGFVTAQCIGGSGECIYPYITSTETTASQHRRVYFHGGSCSSYCANGHCGKQMQNLIRCVRRQ